MIMLDPFGAAAIAFAILYASVIFHGLGRETGWYEGADEAFGAAGPLVQSERAKARNEGYGEGYDAAMSDTRAQRLATYARWRAARRAKKAGKA